MSSRSTADAKSGALRTVEAEPALGDEAPLAEDQSAGDALPELSDVEGPVMGDERARSLGIELDAASLGSIPQNLARQEAEIFSAFGERQELKSAAVEPRE